MLLLTVNLATVMRHNFSPVMGLGETLSFTEKKKCIYIGPLYVLSKPVGIGNNFLEDPGKTLLTITLAPLFKEFVEIKKSLTVKTTSICWTLEIRNYLYWLQVFLLSHVSFTFLMHSFLPEINCLFFLRLIKVFSLT